MSLYNNYPFCLTNPNLTYFLKIPEFFQFALKQDIVNRAPRWPKKRKRDIHQTDTRQTPDK